MKSAGNYEELPCDVVECLELIFAVEVERVEVSDEGGCCVGLVNFILFYLCNLFFN